MNTNAATAAMWAFALGLGVGLTIRVYERAAHNAPPKVRR